jgi:poly[(R)-3-hydroxyalkanoate] polymerase subunit PhaC
VLAAPPLTPTPRDEVFRDGTARLYRFRPAATAPRAAARRPVLLVPSLINRWYVLDLRAGSSVAEALVNAGLDVFCLDWGAPEDEDRHLDWDEVVERVGRMLRRTIRAAGTPSAGVVGYCIGGTLAPESVAALVNLAGPIDFSHAGFLGHMTNPRWFDPEAIADAGNVRAEQMQAGFVALRPTSQIAKWVSFLDKAGDAERREAFLALDAWASDNVAFPARAYVRYIRELYQENRLVRGEHAVRGRRVDLGRTACPLLTVVTERDTICPPRAATALGDCTSSRAREVLAIPGGHVGAVVGAEAKTTLYPALVRFFARHLAD